MKEKIEGSPSMKESLNLTKTKLKRATSKEIEVVLNAVASGVAEEDMRATEVAEEKMPQGQTIYFPRASSLHSEKLTMDLIVMIERR